MTKFLPLRAGALLVFALSAAFAEDNAISITITDAVRASMARETLSEVEVLAAKAETHASSLESMISTKQETPFSHWNHLSALKDEVNQMGKDIAALAAERDELPAWEQKALDQVLPLLQNTAANTNKAIAHYRDYPSQLWSPNYRQLAAVIANDTGKIASTLERFKKVERLKVKEVRLEQGMSQVGMN